MLQSVSREDRADHRVSQPRTKLVHRGTGITQAFDSRANALWERFRCHLTGAFADGSDTSLLFGQVDQIEIDAERSNLHPQRFDRLLFQPIAKFPSLFQRRVLSQSFGGSTKMLDEIECRLTFQPFDDFAQNIAEQVDITTQTWLIRHANPNLKHNHAVSACVMIECCIVTIRVWTKAVTWHAISEVLRKE